MSRHLLVGFGYTAGFLANLLLNDQQEVLAISRKKPQTHLDIQHLELDVFHSPIPIEVEDILYYFIPPLAQYEEDILLSKCLLQLPNPPKKIIYIGSSGVYGQQDGNWVHENNACHIETLRQRQRLSAELQLEMYCEKYHIPCARLRTAGIYGPNRIPKEAVLNQSPIIQTAQAPFINHIYIKDLAKILKYLGSTITYHGIVNVADGNPQPMGTLQKTLAELLHVPKAPEISFKNSWETASEMKKEFMSQNKRLDVSLLKQLLRKSPITLHNMQNALNEIIKDEKLK
jgi:nucleoside-diphosphate-sugar epimerase